MCADELIPIGNTGQTKLLQDATTFVAEVVVVKIRAGESITVGAIPSVTLTSLPSVTVASIPSVTVASIPSVTVASLPSVTIGVITPSITVASLPSVTVAAPLGASVSTGAVRVVSATDEAIKAVKIDQTTPGTTNAVFSAPNPQTPTAYRTAVAAADVMAAPGTVTCTKLTGVGALTAGTYNVKVVAVNAHGRTTATAGNTSVVTETTNLGVRAAFAQVAGATHYDIYCSTDSDPKFTGRITEAQRASGIIINTHNVTAAGGTAGAVDIYPIGTGLQAATTAATNYAWVVPASPVNCAGYTYCHFDLTLSRTGDDVAPSLIVAPFLLNSRTSTYQQGQAVTLSFGGTSGNYGSMKQRITVDVRGNSGVALLVQSIAGTGAAVDIDAVLS